MTWINKKSKTSNQQARVFDIVADYADTDKVQSQTTQLSTDNLNSKYLVNEIFTAPSSGIVSISNPYTTATFITISNPNSGKTFYNTAPGFYFKHLQTKLNSTYSILVKDMPITKTITTTNGAAQPSLQVAIIMRMKP